MLKNGRSLVSERSGLIDIFLGSDFRQGSCVDNFMLVVENSRLYLICDGGTTVWRRTVKLSRINC